MTLVDVSRLEKSPHRSVEGKELYWLDKEKGLLTDGNYVYLYEKGKGVSDQPVAIILTAHLEGVAVKE